MIDPTRDTAGQLRDLVDGIFDEARTVYRDDVIDAIDRLAALGLIQHWRVITDDPETWPEQVAQSWNDSVPPCWFAMRSANGVIWHAVGYPVKCAGQLLVMDDMGETLGDPPIRWTALPQWEEPTP